MGVGWGYPLSDFGSRTLWDPATPSVLKPWMGVMTFVVTKRGDIRVCHYVCVMTKREYVQVRVSEGEKAVWVELAGGLGVSLSEWIRQRCNESFGVVPPVVRASDVEVARRVVRERAPGNLPSAVQVAKRPFKSDFK